MVDNPFAKEDNLNEPATTNTEPEGLSEEEVKAIIGDTKLDEKVPEEVKPSKLDYQLILEEYGMESNIPVNHRYWRIRP